MPGFEVNSKFGVLAPVGTPAPIVKKISDAIKDILTMPEVKESLLQQGVVASYANSNETTRLIKSEYDRWYKIIKEANIQAE